MNQRFDSLKNSANIYKHGLSFEDADALDWSTAINNVDNHIDYGETSFITYAMMNDRLHCLIWT